MNDNNNDNSPPNKKAKKPLTIGVFGGSFNPIHLGHSLLAITVQQTKSVDAVVLVPVYKHAVKTDLLPFDDRVHMCRLAVAPFGDALQVSTIERDVGKSNGAMLRALKQQYPADTRFLWICGDDFFRWMDRPAGLDTLQEVSGLIVQRRLHKDDDDNNKDQQRFFKEPIDEHKIRHTAVKMDLQIDFVNGELPHFSSTLVRRAPGNWKSFLTQTVSEYLQARPHLLQQLITNLEADANHESGKEQDSVKDVGTAQAADIVLRGMEAVHALQIERGRSGLFLSTGHGAAELETAQAQTDALLQEIVETAIVVADLVNFDEARSLNAELLRIPVWLADDRAVQEKRGQALVSQHGVEGWLARLAVVQKYNPRIDVLINSTVRAFTEILENSNRRTGKSKLSLDKDLPELLFKWSEGKEALGRLRAFVCAGGPTVPDLVRGSLKMRKRLNSTIGVKDTSIARVLSLEAGMSSRLTAPDALHKMLENVTLQEWHLMGCFSSSTPLVLVHKIMDRKEIRDHDKGDDFDVKQFFDASSSAIDFLLTFAKALAASACARA